MDKPINNTRFLLGSMYIFLVTGSMVLMTSALLSNLMQHYRLSYEQGGLLLSLLAAGSLISNFLSGALAMRFGRKATLCIAAFCYLAGYAGLTLLPPLWALQILLFITGLGWGAFNNLINFLVTLVTGGDGRKILMVHTAFSIGAFLAPLLLGITVSYGLSWRIPAGIQAFLSLLLVFSVLLMPIPENKDAARGRQPLNLGFLRKWRFYLYMLLLFTYVGAETSYSGWLVSYLTGSQDFAGADAQFLLSIMWVAIIAGRIAIAFLASKRRMAAIMLIQGIVVFVGSLLLILTGQPFWLGVSVVIIGLSLSAFYGMILANASDLVVESSLASGLMMALGSLGATLMPLLVGIFAENAGVLAGMRFLTASAGFLFLLTAVSFWSNRRRSA